MSRTIGDAPVKGVNGRMTLADALARALEGTGWRAEATKSGSFRLVRDAAGEVGTPGDIVVTARRTDFARNDTGLLSRTKTPLRQTPATVDSVTEEVIKSQNVTSVAEALRNIPGVILLNGTTSDVMVNGDVTNNVSFTNGLRNSSVGGNPPISDIESVEVLKGAASILTGAQVSGGVVNFVPKRANGADKREITLGAGTGAEFTTTFDVGGRLGGDGFTYRATGQAQVADKRPNGADSPHSHVVNGMLGYRGDTLDLDLGVQIYDTRTALVDLASYDPVAGVYSDYGSRLNSDRFLSVNSKRVTYGIEKALASGSDFTLKFRARGLVQRTNMDGQFQIPLVYDLPGLGSFIIGSATKSTETQYSDYADLYAQFATGGIKHQAIIAFDYSWQTRRTQSSDPSIGFTAAEALPLAVVDPSQPFSTTREKQYGVVFQDQMTLGPVHALIGLRETWYHNAYVSSANIAYISRFQKLLPSVGVVFDISSALSVYGSYRQGLWPLAPDAYPTSDGRPLLPRSEKRQELGFKSGLFDNRLTINGAYYWYSRENEGVVDPTTLGGQFYYVNGPGTSGKGGEVSFAGSVTPGLKILGGFTYDSRKRKDGYLVTGQPKYVANFWGIKTFTLGEKSALDFGFGGNYNSGMVGYSILTNTPTGPVYYNVDRAFIAFRATVGYRSGGTRINLSVDNLFDRRNYEPVDVVDAVPLAPPRVIRLVVSQAF